LLFDLLRMRSDKLSPRAILSCFPEMKIPKSEPWQQERRLEVMPCRTRRRQQPLLLRRVTGRLSRRGADAAKALQIAQIAKRPLQPFRGFEQMAQRRARRRRAYIAKCVEHVAIALHPDAETVTSLATHRREAASFPAQSRAPTLEFALAICPQGFRPSSRCAVILAHQP
jgi:hypothetical protein